MNKVIIMWKDENKPFKMMSIDTIKEDMELNQLIMDLVNEYDGKPPKN